MSDEPKRWMNAITWLVTRNKRWTLVAYTAAIVVVSLATDTFVGYVAVIALIVVIGGLANLKGYNEGLEVGTKLSEHHIREFVAQGEVVKRSRSDEMIANARWN
jgi:hypothetical protein